jgi:hypothetical protein
LVDDFPVRANQVSLTSLCKDEGASATFDTRFFVGQWLMFAPGKVFTRF